MPVSVIPCLKHQHRHNTFVQLLVTWRLSHMQPVDLLQVRPKQPREMNIPGKKLKYIKIHVCILRTCLILKKTLISNKSMSEIFSFKGKTRAVESHIGNKNESRDAYSVYTNFNTPFCSKNLNNHCKKLRLIWGNL